MGVVTQGAGPAALVILDWPEKRNALGPEQTAELAAALRTVAADPDVRGVVITGNGAFCAGGDIKGMVARADMPPEERRALVYSAYQGLIPQLVPEDEIVSAQALSGTSQNLALVLGTRQLLQERQDRLRLVLARGPFEEDATRLEKPGPSRSRSQIEPGEITDALRSRP